MCPWQRTCLHGERGAVVYPNPIHYTVAGCCCALDHMWAWGSVCVWREYVCVQTVNHAGVQACHHCTGSASSWNEMCLFCVCFGKVMLNFLETKIVAKYHSLFLLTKFSFHENLFCNSSSELYKPPSLMMHDRPSCQAHWPCKYWQIWHCCKRLFIKQLLYTVVSQLCTAARVYIF